MGDDSDFLSLSKDAAKGIFGDWGLDGLGALFDGFDMNTVMEYQNQQTDNFGECFDHYTQAEKELAMQAIGSNNLLNMPRCNAEVLARQTGQDVDAVRSEQARNNEMAAIMAEQAKKQCEDQLKQIEEMGMRQAQQLAATQDRSVAVIYAEMVMWAPPMDPC